MGMKGGPEEQIRAIDEQIQKLRKIRARWEDGEDLSPDEKYKQGLTVELLNGAIDDLRKKKRELQGHQTT
jgi:hypothetical protein